MYKWLMICAGSLVFSACIKNVERKGCTDPLATNYSTLADVDDGSCEYVFKEQLLWQNGSAGAWDENFVEGAIAILSCIGSTEVQTVGVDTAGNPIQALAIQKDTNDYFSIVGSLVNGQDARPYRNGFLRFDAMLPAGSQLAILDVAIHGGTCFDFGACPNICRSGAQQVVTSYLSDTAFTEVAIPLLDFPNRKFANAHTLFMFSRQVDGGGPDDVLLVDNIRWTNM